MSTTAPIDAPPATRPAPFLRWAGGKRRLMTELRTRLPRPEDFTGRFFEPFLGGAALFFEHAVPGTRCVVNDAVPDLALTYTVLRDHPDELIDALRVLARHTDEDAYYAQRKKTPRSAVARAARTIYLNQTCFNGLHRTNAAGRFNVAFGHRKHPVVCNEALLRADAARLQGATIRTGDFADAVRDAKAGDFVYFDPPHIPSSPTASFTKYAKDDFRESDHRRLAAVIDELSARGVLVMASNSDTPLTRSIFSALRLDAVTVSRSVAASASRRGHAGEVIGTNYR